MKKLTQLITTGALLAPMAAMAGDAGEIAQNIGGQASVATVTAIMISALLGIILLIMGGMGFKKYADNPQQTPLSKPIIFLGAGALLFGLSATSDTMQSTIFGESDAESGSNVDFGANQEYDGTGD